MEHIKEFKFVSEKNGGVTYLIINENTKEISSDYFLNNGGWRPLNQTKKKEIKRLEQYYKNVLEYKENNNERICK